MAESRHQGMALDRLYRERSQSQSQPQAPQPQHLPLLAPGGGANSQPQEQLNTQSQPPQQQQCQPSTWLKAQTPLTFFRKDRLAAERARGVPWNPCAAATWSACRRAFEALTADERAAWEMKPEATKLVAAANRQERRRHSQQHLSEWYHQLGLCRSGLAFSG